MLNGDAWPPLMGGRAAGPQSVCSLVEVDQQVPRLLSDPRAGEVSGHPGDVDPACGQLQEEQDVDSFQEHRGDRRWLTRRFGGSNIG